MEDLPGEVDRLFERSDARLHAFFNQILQEIRMEANSNGGTERRPIEVQGEQLTLFEVRSFLGRVCLIQENVVYPQFGNWNEEAEHDPFIDDLSGLPTDNDIA